MNVIYKLPARFYFDHLYRDLPSGTLVSQTQRYVVVELDRESYDDLLSDADYYSNSWMFERDLLGLCSSAKATARILRATPLVEIEQ